MVLIDIVYPQLAYVQLASTAFAIAISSFSSILTLVRAIIIASGRYLPIYGPTGVLFALISQAEVWNTVKSVLHSADSKAASTFKDAQISQANMVGVTGAIIAQVAITALSFMYLSESHWVARAFFLASLVSGCISVYYAMHLMRTLGSLTTDKEIQAFLRAPVEKIKPEWEVKNQPSLAAVLILDSPKSLVDLLVLAFLVGLSVYILFIWINKLDLDAGSGDSRNVFIFYIVTLWVCVGLYNKARLFNYYSQPETDFGSPFIIIWSISRLLNVIADCMEGLGLRKSATRPLRRWAEFMSYPRPRQADAELQMRRADVRLFQRANRGPTRNHAPQSGQMPPIPPPATHLQPGRGTQQEGPSHIAPASLESQTPGLRGSSDDNMPSRDQEPSTVSESPDPSLPDLLKQAIEVHRRCADVDQQLATAYEKHFNGVAPVVA